LDLKNILKRPFPAKRQLAMATGGSWPLKEWSQRNNSAENILPTNERSEKFGGAGGGVGPQYTFQTDKPQGKDRKLFCKDDELTAALDLDLTS
jgi:hypothetical protein